MCTRQVTLQKKPDAPKKKGPAPGKFLRTVDLNKFESSTKIEALLEEIQLMMKARRGNCIVGFMSEMKP